MQNIIFLDIDGTIIDGTRGLDLPTEKTKYAVKELCKNNYVFIASGRNRCMIPPMIKDLNPNGYVLCNGAYAEANGKLIYKQSFDIDTINKIVDVTEKNSGFVVLETVEEVSVRDTNDLKLLQFLKMWGQAKDGFEDCDVFDNEYSICMNVFNNEEDCLSMEKELSDCCDVLRHGSFFSYDINIKGVNKGIAVEKVSKALNIPIENTYAFGDGINDLEMLLTVKHGVVMQNCNPILNEYNLEKTKDVLYDGVYNYLVEHKLIKPM